MFLFFSGWGGVGVFQDEGGSRRSGSRKRGRVEQGSGQRQKQKQQRQEQQQAATKSRTNGAGNDKVAAKSKLLNNAATARKYKRLRQELVSILYREVLSVLSTGL